MTLNAIQGHRSADQVNGSRGTWICLPMFAKDGESSASPRDNADHRPFLAGPRRRPPDLRLGRRLKPDLFRDDLSGSPRSWIPACFAPPSLPSGWMNPAYLSGSRTATIASDLLVKQCARPVPYSCSSAAFWSASLSPCSFFPRLTGFDSASGRSNSPAMGRSIIRCETRAPESCPG
jgi:hypothetical protein